MDKRCAWIVWVLAANGAAANDAQLQGGIRSTELAPGEQIAIDGQLDDSAWQRATAYPVAHQFSPATTVIDIPETTYRVMTDREYLYVGIDCRDPHPDKIWQALGHRDATANANADTVTVWLDPSGKRKLAQMFKIAVGGAIRDGTYYEDSGKVDASPDFSFVAVTKVNENGWSVEFKIPASSLRMTRHRQPTLLITRFYPRGDNFFFASTDIDERHQCFLCKNPKLAGLSNMQPGRALTVTPYASATQSTGDFGDSLKGRAGADLKWRVNESTVVDITAWPDFSQVELDTPQLSANATYALFYPEKRPFFLEGLDLFDTPMRAVYTRTLTKPTWGARVTHRGNLTEAALLAAQDSGGGLLLLPGPWSTDFIDQPESTAAVARSRFHVGGTQLGVVAALKDYGAYGNNVVGGGDAVYSTKSNRFNAQVLLSSTSALAGVSGVEKSAAQSDSAAYLGWAHNSKKWRTRTFVQRVGKEFRDDSGFVEANGLYAGEVFVGRNVKPVFGLSEVLLFGMARHKQTLVGETIATSYLPGVGVNAGATYMELTVSPGSRQRTEAAGVLHRLSSAEFFAVATPARWLPTADALVEVGDRLDTLSDRVGTGYLVRLAPTFLICTRLRIGVALAQEQIAADERTLLRDSVAELNASYFFDANNELRGTYQHHETYRDPLAFMQPVTERTNSDLLSLVYTWTPSLGKAFYAGGTWSSAKDVTHTEGAEFFLKMSWAF